jgi:hypothetical protein
VRDSVQRGVFKDVNSGSTPQQTKKDKTMKKTLLLAVAVAGVFTFTTSAQLRPTGDDGIAASPKFRQQFLNEHKKVASTTVAAVRYQGTGDDGIAASPRMRQQINERKTVASTPSSAVVSVGYQPMSKDGIAASPKLRQQLNERGTQFMVAPLK